MLRTGGPPTGAAGAVAAAPAAGVVVASEEAVRICAYVMPAFESTALPPMLSDESELGNCARSAAKPFTRYWPIMAQDPSADTLTRGSGLGDAVRPRPKISLRRRSKR